MTVRSELKTLCEGGGKITVHEIEDWAREHMDSALHHELKFNDEATAAALWRRHHIRQLIAIHVVDAPRERIMVSLSIDRGEGGGYRRVLDVMETRDLRDVMLDDALKELNRVREKYEMLETLASVWLEIDRAEARQSAPQRDARRRLGHPAQDRLVNRN